MSRNDNLDLVTRKVGSFRLWFPFMEYMGLREILMWECCLWYIPFVGKGMLYVREIYFEVGGLRCVAKIDGKFCLEKVTYGKRRMDNSESEYALKIFSIFGERSVVAL